MSKILLHHLSLVKREKSSIPASHRNIPLRRGFTIVELLIVVVVIAILAAITIVAYNGISTQAKEAALKADLVTAAKKIHIEKTESGVYPANKPAGLRDSIAYTGGANTFCATVAEGSISFYITEAGVVIAGNCPQHVAIQSFTRSQCNALAVYNGTNPAAIVQLYDFRGDGYGYEVAKLADNNCWMLNNLKLGSTNTPITLTSADSDVDENFTLPRLEGTGAEWVGYDTPAAYGPVTGDTGVGASNYGYLYNWSAATAGETTATLPGNSIAPHSICPANWHLPSGSNDGEYAMLNAKMNNPNATIPSTASGSGYYQNWQYTGPFRGVNAGGFVSTNFYEQGSSGFIWTATGGEYQGAFFVGIWGGEASSVYISDARYMGFSVRCALS